MFEYTIATLLSMIAVILLEIFWFRTGVFRSAQYWVSLAIMFSFQILVDGWLTKLSDPIVIYASESMLGIRFPWDIPIEDFGFGFAMLTLTILIWKRVTSPPVDPASRHEDSTDDPHRKAQHDPAPQSTR